MLIVNLLLEHDCEGVSHLRSVATIRPPPIYSSIQTGLNRMCLRNTSHVFVVAIAIAAVVCGLWFVVNLSSKCSQGLVAQQQSLFLSVWNAWHHVCENYPSALVPNSTTTSAVNCTGNNFCAYQYRTCMCVCMYQLLALYANATANTLVIQCQNHGISGTLAY